MLTLESTTFSTCCLCGCPVSTLLQPSHRIPPAWSSLMATSVCKTVHLDEGHSPYFIGDNYCQNCQELVCEADFTYSAICRLQTKLTDVAETIRHRLITHAEQIISLRSQIRGSSPCPASWTELEAMAEYLKLRIEMDVLEPEQNHCDPVPGHIDSIDGTASSAFGSSVTLSQDNACRNASFSRVNIGKPLQLSVSPALDEICFSEGNTFPQDQLADESNSSRDSFWDGVKVALDATVSRKARQSSTWEPPSRLPFFCNFNTDCANVQFRRIKEMQDHITNEHGGEDLEHPIHCSKCLKRYRRREDLKIHSERHHGGTPSHACPDCGLLFWTEKVLKTHCLRTHSEGAKDSNGLNTEMLSFEKNFTMPEEKPTPLYCNEANCLELKVEFRRLRKMKDHITEVHGGVDLEHPFHCGQCQKRYEHFRDLRTHVLQSHGGSSSHPCPKCGKPFWTKKAVFRHHLRVHTHRQDVITLPRSDVTPYEALPSLYCNEAACIEMNMKFDCLQEMREHINQEHNGNDLGHPYHCHNCQKRFGNRKDLKVHNMRYHGDTPTHPCGECGRPFWTETGLLRHCLLVHLSKTVALGTMTMATPSTVPVTCVHDLDAIPPTQSESETNVTNPSQVKRRKGNACEPLPPLYCNEAGCRNKKLEFTCLQDMKQHLVQEHGTSGLAHPFHCNNCPRRCWSREELKIHVLRHHGGSPSYPCPKCGRLFLVRRDLRTHEKHVDCGKVRTQSSSVKKSKVSHTIRNSVKRKRVKAEVNISKPAKSRVQKTRKS